jgi:hypothetical protein
VDIHFLFSSSAARATYFSPTPLRNRGDNIAFTWPVQIEKLTVLDVIPQEWPAKDAMRNNVPVPIIAGQAVPLIPWEVNLQTSDCSPPSVVDYLESESLRV